MGVSQVYSFFNYWFNSIAHMIKCYIQLIVNVRRHVYLLLLCGVAEMRYGKVIRYVFSFTQPAKFWFITWSRILVIGNSICAFW